MATFGSLAGLGVWLVLMGMDGQRVLPDFGEAATPQYRQDPDFGRRFGFAAAAGLAAWLVTSWIAMGVLFAVGIVLFWGRIGTVKSASKIADRAEAITAWTDQVASGISAGVQINGAIRAAAEHANALIADEAKRLASNLEAMPLERAIGIFANDLSNPASDGVCAAIALSDRHGSSKLTEMLDIQAAQTRDEVTQMLEVTASRQQHVASARGIIGVTIVAALLMPMMSRDYFKLYDSLNGQLIMLAIGGVFYTGFAMLASLGADRQLRRYFTGIDAVTVTDAGGVT